MKKLITGKDIILLACLTAAVLAFSLFAHFGGAGGTAVVRKDGEAVIEISLSDKAYFETEINGVTICREDGAVYIKDSSCPDKVCVRSGRLTKRGQSAVCAPNGVSVEIKGRGRNTPDAVTG